jgi:hypothetical protein
MGTITRNFANNLTTSGLLKAAAFNNDSFDNVTSVPSGSVEANGMVFIKKLTASGSADLSFVDGSNGVVLDNTYKEYYFTFNNIHSAAESGAFVFNVSIDGGSNYNIAKTSTFYRAYNQESDINSGFGYEVNSDLAQGTGDQRITEAENGTDNDQSTSGFMQIFNPSSTTFVKHFISSASMYHKTDYHVQSHMGGYANTTSAVDAIRFKLTSGNIDAGDICLYGIA